MSTPRNQPAAGSPKPSTSDKKNPEIDARLTAYIANNQGCYDWYIKQDKTLLARKLMLHRMNRSESFAKKVDALREVVDASPDLKTRVEAALAKLAPEKRPEAFRAIAQAAIVDQAVAAQRAGQKIAV